jgi:anti-anti-sigma factor
MTSANNPLVEHVIHGNGIVLTILASHMRDINVVNQIREAMLEAVAGSQCKNAIIDVNQVQFIGSIGFLAFLAVRRAEGIENVVLCNMSDNLKELFSICRLIPVNDSSSAPFRVAGTISEALDSL